MITLANLGPGGLRKALEAAHDEEAKYFPGGALARKAQFHARLRIDRQRHVPLIQQRIQAVYETEEIRDAILRHVDHRHNLLRRVVGTVAITYEIEPSRTLNGLPEQANRAFLDAYRDADTAAQSELWGRYAFLCNVVHVLPRWTAPGRLSWATVLPHNCDVLFDPEGEDEPSILIYETKGKAQRVAVDAERWWWLDQNWQVVAEEEHGMGRRPWATFRWEPWTDDYYNRGAGQDLVDATLEVGRIAAQMSWVRKTHSKKLLHLAVGPEAKVPPLQSFNGEAPFMSEGGVNLEVVDNIVGLEHFLEELREAAADVLEGYGLPAHAVNFASTQDPTGTGPGPGPSTHDRLVKIRNRQIKFHKRSELELAELATLVLTKAGALTGVTVDQVHAAFRIDYAPMTFVDHPKAQVETAQAQMEVGGTNPYKFHQSQNPGLTIEEAKAEVMHNIRERGEFIDFVASRNMPLDPSKDTATIAQIQGSIGGSNNEKESTS